MELDVEMRFCQFAGYPVMLGLLIGLASAGSAMARGGGHGMGGFGIRGEGRMGRGGGMMGAPDYVLIAVSSVTDAAAFKKTLEGLPTELTSFSGRLAADLEKPVSWEGIASEYLVMLQFPNAEQAQAWKNSDAFKSFDADLRRSTTATMQLVQGLPMPSGRGGRGGRFDAKAFEPNVKDYDRLLDQRIKNICKGC
jgi:uncharacterized protein (DUF1330 family)